MVAIETVCVVTLRDRPEHIYYFTEKNIHCPLLLCLGNELEGPKLNPIQF